ncbi:Transposon Tf2-6 polyprotein [Eumeta japonica]|uniref:Transposon Tf2-6 polyprotein n=1 Tax=Eumeta variegata TaxID=151549 RepID=A0A4C1VV17_EUMVA|nr:Transposon Tf2-6 polyprotein [Eumeta japonica]
MRIQTVDAQCSRHSIIDNTIDDTIDNTLWRAITGRWSSPPIGTCNLNEVTSALPASEFLKYLTFIKRAMERDHLAAMMSRHDGRLTGRSVHTIDEYEYIEARALLSNGCTTYTGDASAIARRAQAAHGTFGFTGVGAVLQQFVNDSWQPLGFYSNKLSDTQQKYSAYDRELLAIYMAIKHFRNQIESRQLTIYTDHKPITYAFAKIDTDSETPRRTRQLLFISEFTTDIGHVSGEGNAVAYALMRVDAITCPTTINFEELSVAQSDDATLTHLLQDTDSSAKLKRIFLSSGQTSIVCDLTSKNARPYLPEKFRKLTFDCIHNMSHPGIRTSTKEAKFPIGRLKPAYVLNETDVTDETSPQKVHFTLPEFPSPTYYHETPKISRSGRIIRRPVRLVYFKKGGGAGVAVAPHTQAMRQRSRDGLRLHTALSQNAAREQIHYLICAGGDPARPESVESRLVLVPLAGRLSYKVVSQLMLTSRRYWHCQRIPPLNFPMHPILSEGQISVPGIGSSTLDCGDEVRHPSHLVS